MEIEKRIWDMQKQDYINVFFRFWIAIALVSVVVAGGFFIFGYYDRIINENYTSKIEYQFLYLETTPPTPENPSGISRFADPARYVNVYKRWYADLDIVKAVEATLEKNLEKELHYTSMDIRRMTEISYANYNLTISVITKKPEHSQIVLKLLQDLADPRIKAEIDTIQLKDPNGASLEINSIIAVPGLGINYETEEEVITGLLLNFVFTFAGIFIALYIVAVVATNFNGRFRRHDVFENNYQIPVLGEISVKINKE